MIDEDLEDWAEFESKISALSDQFKESGSPLVFRGQSDSTWPLTTTLERYGCKGICFSDYYRLTNRIKPAAETFTNEQWDIPEISLEFLQSFNDPDLFSGLRYPWPSYYRYMVYLRHNGFPSPLLDWTYSANVAAYFSFRDLITTVPQRSIFVYCEMPKGHKATSPFGAAMRRIGPYVRSHPRHFRQQSDYTICAKLDRDMGWVYQAHGPVFDGRGEQDFLWKFNLPSSQQEEILRILDGQNLNAYSLFDTAETLLETLWVREHVLKGGNRRDGSGYLMPRSAPVKPADLK